MIKEIFLIDRSILQFHYSSEESASDDDKAVLSSGFFSAIQDFSAHARSDVLDSFSTENEYFLYLRFPDSDRVLVGVFDRKAPEAFAREAMEKIQLILLQVKMPDVEGMQLPPEKKGEIRDQISQINIQLFSDERLSTVVIDLLEGRSDIPLAFLVDSSTNSLITSFSRPKPLFKESHVREFLLLHSTLKKTLENLEMNPKYSYFVVESDDYAVVACNGGRLLSVASGAMKTPIENVYEAATSICYADVFDPEIEHPIGGTVLGEMVFQDGRVTSSSGKDVPTKAQIFVSTLKKNIESLFRSLTRRPFLTFSVRIIGEPSTGLSLSQMNGELKLQLLRF
ncbi:MAG: hypothetical protein ACXAAN_10135 [Candidatus Thorarchaeota archaeon]|jgi:hypothetical protein